MRKILSIPLALIILFSGLTVNLASHYCQGVIVDTRISFSGDNAGCGMEDQENEQTCDSYTDLCCVNITSSYTLNNNYIPPVILSENSGDQLFNIELPVAGITVEEPSVTDRYISKNPPGSYIPAGVDREMICIYLI